MKREPESMTAPLQQPQGDADVSRAPLDLERLSRQTYLTVDELVAYLRFPSRKAAYHWVIVSGIPKCRRGRTLLFLRRDVDGLVQGQLPRRRSA